MITYCSGVSTSLKPSRNIAKNSIRKGLSSSVNSNFIELTMDEKFSQNQFRFSFKIFV